MSNDNQTPAENTAPTESPMITSNGESYFIDTLPADLQRLVHLYQRWENELHEQQIEVFKTEAAIRGLSAELESRFKELSNSQ